MFNNTKKLVDTEDFFEKSNVYGGQCVEKKDCSHQTRNEFADRQNTKCFVFYTI